MKKIGASVVMLTVEFLAVDDKSKSKFQTETSVSKNFPIERAKKKKQASSLTMAQNILSVTSLWFAKCDAFKNHESKLLSIMTEPELFHWGQEQALYDLCEIYYLPDSGTSASKILYLMHAPPLRTQVYSVWKPPAAVRKKNKLCNVVIRQKLPTCKSRSIDAKFC